MKTSILLRYSLIILIIMTQGCSHRAHQKESQKLDEAADALPANNNRFAFDILQQIPYDENNMVISPFSISTALAMTYTGAREVTREEMARVMHFNKDQQIFPQAFGRYLSSLKEMAEDSIELNIANSLWAQEDYHFLESFFETNKKHYNSETFLVDFRTQWEQVRLEINDWVYDETREKIKDLIAPGVLTDDTRLVLANAIHFFGPWMMEFDPDNTRENFFHPTPDNHVTADFMHRSDTLPYFENDAMQALEIPYAGGDFSMLFLLPAEGNDLQSLEAALDADEYVQIINQLQKKEVDIFIPKYEAETKLDLEETLMAMGMEQAFNRFADFSGMTGDLSLKIDKVIHQAMIEVAEEGTEAAAATAVVVIRKTAIDPDPRTVFMANRPFMFFIKDNKYQSILFAGRVMNPEK